MNKKLLGLLTVIATTTVSTIVSNMMNENEIDKNVNEAFASRENNNEEES